MLKDWYYYCKAYLSVFVLNGKEALVNVGMILLMFVCLALVFVPFIAHILACMSTGSALMLLVGVLILPYGWAHGLGVLLGWWS